LPQVDTLFVVSEYLEEKYKRTHGNLNIKRSVPSYLDYDLFLQYQKADIFKLPNYNFDILRNDSVKILFSGTCIFTNGLTFFLDCVSQLILSNSSLKVDIIFLFFKGHVDFIRNYTHKIGLEDYVTIYENIYFQHIPAIYTYVDILVLPEMGEIIAKAGFPGKSAEYLASGKAIISTDFSNLKDYFFHEINCLMSPLQDRTSYSENLLRLINDEELRVKLGLNAIKTARKYFDYKKAVNPIIESL
jgi:glycosyltransferase involved in cell wall biosynthesis